MFYKNTVYLLYIFSHFSHMYAFFNQMSKPCTTIVYLDFCIILFVGLVLLGIGLRMDLVCVFNTYRSEVTHLSACVMSEK
jgi:hypothetical protein